MPLLKLVLQVLWEIEAEEEVEVEEPLPIDSLKLLTKATSKSQRSLFSVQKRTRPMTKNLKSCQCQVSQTINLTKYHHLSNNNSNGRQLSISQYPKMPSLMAMLLSSAARTSPNQSNKRIKVWKIKALFTKMKSRPLTWRRLLHSRIHSDKVTSSIEAQMH